MFIVPGILGLVVCVIARPFDLFALLRGFPLLHLATLLAALGFAIDLRVRFVKPWGSWHSAWAIAFVLWCLVIDVVVDPTPLGSDAVLLVIALILYLLLTHGVQTFKSFEIVAIGVIACTAWVGATALDLAARPKECVVFAPGLNRFSAGGEPTGQACEQSKECGGEANGDFDREYSCERVGLFGLTSVGEGRVRYAGTLHDPNEVALLLAANLPFIFAFYQRRRSRLRRWLALALCLGFAGGVFFTRSRGGLLIFVAVLVVYGVRRWGWLSVARLAVPALALALPLIAMRAARADAAASTSERLECWQAGLWMLQGSPLLGIGYNRFTDHHQLTAHNAYILAASELGLIGMMLFTGVVYVSVKGVAQATRRCHQAGWEPGKIWGDALLTALIGLAVGIFFLSFTYHQVLWLYLGLAAAFFGVVRRRDAGLRLRLGWNDLAFVGGANLVTLLSIYLYTLT